MGSTRTLFRTIVLAVACMALTAGPAAAQSPVIAQCAKTNTVTPGRFSIAQLEYAKSHLPTDIGAYTLCATAIQSAIDQALGHGGRGAAGSTGGSSGSSFLPAWLIVLIVVVLVGGGAATVAARRRR